MDETLLDMILNHESYDNIKKCMNNAYKMDIIDVIYNKLVI